MTLTPLKLCFLLHVYAISEPFDNPNTLAYAEAKEELLAEDLIVHTDAWPCGFKLTPRGVAFVAMILNTPLPMQRWIDPRELTQ